MRCVEDGTLLTWRWRARMPAQVVRFWDISTDGDLLDMNEAREVPDIHAGRGCAHENCTDVANQ